MGPVKSTLSGDYGLTLTIVSVSLKKYTFDMDDEKKLQTIYSYIVEHTSYDSRYYQAPNTLPYESRTAYGPLEYGTAICGGFSWRSICSVKRQGFPAGTSPVWDLERIICGTAL